MAKYGLTTIETEFDVRRNRGTMTKMPTDFDQKRAAQSEK